jgi:hypothetical protein
MEISRPIQFQLVPLCRLDVKRAITLATQKLDLQTGPLRLEVPLNGVAKSLGAQAVAHIFEFGIQLVPE